ncbi:CooT family nickel-binding protein [Methanobacterium congolense]|uniref:RNA-binding protein n=1 Tax=Methanobacterium congolense TaxID=118062 RepID=A0A1D3L4F5_9EURY|nr:CooT family nickel-binding protein [Methanobacterium congolense]SCG86512.1 putative protein MTH_1128 [Methanobacterium congolense]
MCESTVYSTKGEKIMEDVLHIKIEGKKIHLADVLNQIKDIEGKIVEIDLDKHGIYVELI